ncbi:unnamed protein product (macronuclear) [Paramecium tetraurelia]|uniref:BEACH domain-containing protein n=1 Tax=Paramecium tetraurelia TaxID=5888 RepID=A0CRD0_PARTE|nr:uncharacterized protein GSPATT00009662001 [Paramecium tetraurelia]CAK73347.1 unnamed protein product [Paramecium tetraurelia]|eukprot:XP_001440744.1 hypothetical protein (macronuclear) [Paramecium tetraurelia strain d4-2]
MLISQRQPLIQFDDFMSFLGSQWIRLNYLSQAQSIECQNDFVNFIDQSKGRIKIDQEQLAKLETTNQKINILTLFIYGYYITYIEKQLFCYIFFKKFINAIDRIEIKSLEHLQQIIEPQHPICKSILLECIIMLLHQSNQLLETTEQNQMEDYVDDFNNIPESKLFYKQAYIHLVDQMKGALFKCYNQGQILITIFINQLFLSEEIYAKIQQDQATNILLNDTKFIIELMEEYITCSDKAILNTRSIIKQTFLSNYERQGKISQQIFNNLQKLNDQTILSLKAIKIWLNSKNQTVFQQILSFLENTFENANFSFEYNEQCIKISFEILTYIQSQILQDNVNFTEELQKILIQIFHILWITLEQQTNNQLEDQKTEFWLNYIHKLNLLLNPLTPNSKEAKNIKECAGLYLILHDHHNIKKYISSTTILFHFIDQIYPLDQILIKQNPLLQKLIKSSIEYLVDPILSENKEIMITIQKVLKQVQFISPQQKKNIFQYIWTKLIPENRFYLEVLQMVVTLYLENEDQMLGTRNSFFISILEMQSHKRIVHPQKFLALLQICQYLCLENAPINIEEIFSQNDSNANCLKLKQFKIKRSFQEFFQVNNYYNQIINLISATINPNNLVQQLKEFIKLLWLLTEGLKLCQVDFADDFVQFLEQKLSLFTDDQMRELIELLFDCSVSMISRFIRQTNVSNTAEQYGEVMIQNEFCLKVLVETFLFNTSPSEQLRLKCLQFLGILISMNDYNKMIFREAIRLSNFLLCMRNQKNKSLQLSMEEVLKRSLSFIRDEQIQKLIQNAPIETQKNKVFKQSAFSQYVGTTLENLSNSGSETKFKRYFQLLGNDSGIIIRNYKDLCVSKSWKSFSILMEFKREGFHFINSNAKTLDDIYKKEQILFAYTGHLERQEKGGHQGTSQKQNIVQVDLITVSLINQNLLSEEQNKNHLDNLIKIAILNSELQVQEFTISYTQQQKDETILLIFMFDDRRKGEFIVYIQNQKKQTFSVKPFLSEYIKKHADKHPLSVNIGAYYQNQQFQRTFQGIINNFILVENILVEKQIAAIFSRAQKNLVTAVEEETMNFGDEIQSREMQYLEFDKFKSSFQIVEIKDVLKITRAQNVQDQNFLMNMLKKQIQHKISYEQNQEAKVFYQGANIIEDTSLAEVFLSLENIEIILFIISITTQTYFEIEPQERRSCKLRSVKEVLQNGSTSSKGVFKRTNHFDSQSRQLFLVKDLRKCRDDYINCQQYQLNLKKQNSSMISQGESPLQQRQNFIQLDQNSSNSNTNSISLASQFQAASQKNIDQLDQTSLFNIPITQVQSTFSQELQSPFVMKSNQSEQKQSSPGEVPNLEVPSQIIPKEKFTLEQFNIDRKVQSYFVGRKNTRNQTCNISATKAFQMNQNLKNVAEIQSDKNINWNQQNSESIIIDSNLYHCEWIRVKMQIYGELKILEKGKIIQFQSDGSERPDQDFYIYGTIPYNLKKLKKTKIINSSQILEIQTRRYSHKEIAIEIFCKNTKSYFFVLYDQDRRTQFLNQIKQNNLFTVVVDKRAEFLAKEYTKKWVKGKLSNFEYLMLINKYSGRSFNDLNQYPIFPWVIGDYTSKSIDLTKRETYRDLEKMISASNEERLKNCKIRAESLRQTQNEYFLFGSHYSVAAQIINTLVRLEPFTTLSCELQDGKLDQPDRIFFSVSNIWQSCQNDNQDYRELIPEYFYLPEFLKNINKIQFGERQNQELVDDVILPPWASSCEEFIEINRQALESSYVSEKLHNWINLIFGPYAQGEEAKKRDNLYHWLTYDSCLVYLEKMSSQEKLGYLAQIQQFGQVPFQLFVKPHWPKQKLQLNLFSPTNLIKLLSEKKYINSKRIKKFDKKFVIQIYRESENLHVLLNDKQVYKIKQYNNQERRDSEEKLTNALTFSIRGNEKLHSKGLQFQFDDHVLFVCGYLSGAVYIYNLLTDKSQQAQICHKIKLHKKRVTCLSYSSKLKILCLGAKDNRVTIWNAIQGNEKLISFQSTPSLILYGHDKTIKCVHIDDALQVVLSVDKIGKLQIHSIISGLFLQDFKLYLAQSEKVKNIVTNGNGLIVVYTNQNQILATSVNGLIIQRYLYKNIGNITQISSFLQSHLLVSTLRGEILLIQDIASLPDQPPIFFHLYQNTSNIGIVTFSSFIESESLVFIISLMDGTLHRYVISCEQNGEFYHYLGKLGM